MAIIKMSWPCQVCGGTGIRHYLDRNGQPVTENPCLTCGGDGIYDGAGGIDGTLIQQIISTQGEVIDILKKILEIIEKGK